MKRQQNPVFITYINPKGIYNFQGTRLDIIGIATVLKENGKVSHGLSIKSILDPMNRKKGSDMAVGRAFSSKPCLEYNNADYKIGVEYSLKDIHKNFVNAVKQRPEWFIQLQTAVKKKQVSMTDDYTAIQTINELVMGEKTLTQRVIAKVMTDDSTAIQ